MDRSKIKIGLLCREKTEKVLEILSISRDWETEHNLCFLVKNGKTPALKELLDMKLKKGRDYQKLLVTIKQQLQTKFLLQNPSKVKRGKNNKDVIELKGGNARLFCFFQDDGRLIVCTNTYWKTKPSRKEQNTAFEKATSLMNEYRNKEY